MPRNRSEQPYARRCNKFGDALCDPTILAGKAFSFMSHKPDGDDQWIHLCVCRHCKNFFSIVNTSPNVHDHANPNMHDKNMRTDAQKQK